MSSPVVDTSAGRLRGSTSESGIHRFVGVPYGEPTGGERRFEPPQRRAPWSGVRDATQYGPICPQLGALVDPAQSDARVIGEVRYLPQSEDCLVLNVWTPGLGDGVRRPVLLWLHGRGFSAGAGSEVWYDGANLAKRGDVVVVTVNHRLNAFGYLHLADHLGDEFDGSGVVGLLDVVLALEWVRDNAAAFGGDAGNVTIFGESGGGAKVSTMLALPAAKGLFHRAVVQSGPGLRAVERDAARAFTERLLAALEIPAKDARKLQQVAPQALLDAIAKLPPGKPGTGPFLLGSPAMFQLSPVVDGVHLPQHPFHPTAAPAGAAVPLMIGTNLDESAMFVAADPKRRKLSEADLVRRLGPMLGDKLDRVLSTYKRTRPDATPWDLFIAITTEPTRIMSMRLAERKAEGGTAPAYMYLFTWASDFMGGLFKSSHALEIPFVFDNVEGAPITGSRPDRGALAELMSETWLAFARNGDPNHAGLPSWRPYTKQRRDTMILDVPPRAEQAPRQEEIDAWRDIEVRRV
ncbi:MAG TPA: carboxylesterase/lipase family protein [Myxococcota bacterium]|nr:carboxylesterase/lipase family protein [Myxococcota bacterium]